MSGYRWRWHGGNRLGRPIRPRTIKTELPAIRFVTITNEGPQLQRKEPVIMTPDEIEALRLVDCEGVLQEEASRRMGVSRGTVWRCLDSARRKIGVMLEEGHELAISTDNGQSMNSLRRNAHVIRQMTLYNNFNKSLRKGLWCFAKW